jgi:microcin C transport system ATP-binding protein
LQVLLSVKNLSIGFKNQGHDACVVEDVSFNLEAGKTLALVGESGSGKSITAFSILGLLPYPVAYHPNGSISYHEDGKTFELLNQSDHFLNQFRGKKIGMVFQEPLSALNPLHTIFQQISEPLFIHEHIAKSDAVDCVIDLLEKVDFKEGKDKLNAYPHQLSGGQRQRVMIAQALACNPKILIADEPTTALDVSIQASIIDLLKSLSQERNMSILLISHDLHMVKKMADDVCVMKKGQIVEKGLVKTVFNTPQVPYTKLLIDAEPKGSPQPILKASPIILDASNISVHFGKKSLFKKYIPFKAVDNISLTLKKGETLGIVGESGSGKTTLMLAILKLIKCEGRIVFEGDDLQDFSTKQMRSIRNNLQVIFQDPFGSLNPRLTILQIIEEGLKIHMPSMTKEEREQAVEDILHDISLPKDILTRYPHEFSGGQRQRISLARSLILKPNLLALDEPTSALDRSIQAEILDLLKNLQEKYNLSYLFISHDLSVIKALSHRIIVMKNGKIIEQGETEKILSAPQAMYTKKLLNAAFG